MSFFYIWLRQALNALCYHVILETFQESKVKILDLKEITRDLSRLHNVHRYRA